MIPQSPGSAEALKYLCDFYQKMVLDSINLLTKGMTFYLAITGASVGYVLSQNLKPPLPQFTMFIGLLASLFYGIGSAAWVHGIYDNALVLESLVRRLHPDVFEISGMSQSFRRWRRVLWIFIITSELFVVALMTGMVVMLANRK